MKISGSLSLLGRDHGIAVRVSYGLLRIATRGIGVGACLKKLPRGKIRRNITSFNTQWQKFVKKDNQTETSRNQTSRLH